MTRHLAVCTILLSAACISLVQAEDRLVQIAIQRIDERALVYREVAARLRSGERAETMAQLLHALTHDSDLTAYTLLMDPDGLPATHRIEAAPVIWTMETRPTAHDLVLALPPVLADAIRDAETALDPGPYRLQEFYWRGLMRRYRRDHVDAIRDLRHYVERTGPDHPRAQYARLLIAELLTPLAYSFIIDPIVPDPLGLRLLDDLRRDEPLPAIYRRRAALHLARVHEVAGQAEEAAAAYIWYANTFPGRDLEIAPRVQAGRLLIEAVTEIGSITPDDPTDHPPPADRERYLQQALRALTDHVDLPRVANDENSHAEALYWLAIAYNELGLLNESHHVATRLDWEQPDGYWQHMLEHYQAERTAAATPAP